MITCTRRIQFCAGHRVMGHENKCGHLHGHNYVVEFTAAARDDKLDDAGRVIDFSVLKYRLGGFIQERLDHGFILNHEDHAAAQALSAFKASNGDYQKVYYMPCNPTAENMAFWFLRTIGPDLLDGAGVRLVKVVVHETENCSAEAVMEL